MPIWVSQRFDSIPIRVLHLCGVEGGGLGGGELGGSVEFWVFEEDCDDGRIIPTVHCHPILFSPFQLVVTHCAVHFHNMVGQMVELRFMECDEWSLEARG